MLPDRKWQEEHVEKLRRDLAAGYSLALCAQRINEEFGTDFSRNAAIGKANRIGVNSNPTVLSPRHIKNKAARPRPNRPKVKPPTAPELLRCAEVEPLNLTLLETTERDVCRWPVNDGRPKFLFCGHPRLEGYPYCLSHVRLSIMPLEQRRRRAA